MLTIRIRKKEWVNHLFSVLVILLPFLYQYKGIGRIISLGELLLFPFMVYYLIHMAMRKTVDYIDWPLLMFYLIAVCVTLLNSVNSYFNASEAMSTIVRLVYYALLVYVARKYFDFRSVEKLYFVCIILFSVYLLAQFIVYYGTGMVLPIYLKSSWQFPPEARPENFYRFGFRPSSLFLEPSYYTFFVLPGLAILLFSNEKKWITKWLIVLICMGIIVSTSSGGVIGIGLLLIIKIFRDKDTHGIKAFVSKLGVVLVGICGVLYVLNTQNSRLLRERLFAGASMGQRVLRGIIVYREFDVFHKIFGVGINNMGAYMQFHNISTVYDESNLNNCATIIQSFVYFGIVGCMFLGYYLWTMLKRSRGNIGFPLMVLMIYMMCYENIMYYFRFAFLLILLEAMNRREGREILAGNNARKEIRNEYRDRCQPAQN